LSVYNPSFLPFFPFPPFRPGGADDETSPRSGKGCGVAFSELCEAPPACEGGGGERKMPLDWKEEEKNEFILWTAERYNWNDGALREARRERFQALRPYLRVSRLAKEAKKDLRAQDYSKIPKLQRELKKQGITKSVEELKDPLVIDDAVEELRERVMDSEEYKEKRQKEQKARAVVESFDNKIILKLQEKGLYLPKPLAALDNLDPELEAEVQEILKRRAEKREQYKKGEEKEEQKEQKEKKEEK